MRSVLVVSLALLASLVATQSIADRVDALQGCQKDCLKSALQDANCGETDLECGCNDGGSAKLSLKLAECAAPETLGGKGCTGVQDAIKLSASVCELKDVIVSGAVDLKDLATSGAVQLKDLATSGAVDLKDLATSGAADLKTAIPSGASVVLSHATASLDSLTADPTATGSDGGAINTPAAAPPQITGAPLWAGLGVGVMAIMAL